VKNPGCGWCQKRRRCIQGNQSGPNDRDLCSYYDNFVFDIPKSYFFRKFKLNVYLIFAIPDNWDPYSYNNNVHWNPMTREAEATGFYKGQTSIDPEIVLPGIKFERKLRSH